MTFDLSDDNLMIYAAKHYYNPLGMSQEEFEEDLNRFKYIKRLVNRYNSGGELSPRLILNHLIVVFNVFGIDAGLNILNFRLGEKYKCILKPFLIYLRVIKADDPNWTGIEQDWLVVEELRQIKAYGT